MLVIHINFWFRELCVDHNNVFRPLQVGTYIMKNDNNSSQLLIGELQVDHNNIFVPHRIRIPYYEKCK